MGYDDMVEEALCFGWVDSRPGKVSDTRSKLYFARRKQSSVWSRPNKERIEKLAAAGMMFPAGDESVRVAKANGSWDALNKSDNLELPPEMTAMFESNPTAQQNFEAFSESTRRVTLEWIYSARQEETKLRRIAETVRLAEQNIKAR